jgi:glycosyltransferase involved in cell wall biosynthesis
MNSQKKSNFVPHAGNLVSVIVPTKNSTRTIKHCLESVKNQTYRQFEILVIDGFSTDNTVGIASALDSKVFLINGERTKAKNLGVCKSSGEYLLFLDSDMMLERNVIEECIQTICKSNSNKSSEKTIAAAIIPERSVGSSFWVKIRDFERSFYGGSRIESARFFIKEAVNNVHGFDEDIIGFEESTLCSKLEDAGYDINSNRISSSLLHNEEDFNLRKWLYKKKYYSSTMQLYLKRYRHYAKRQMSILYRIQIFLVGGNWKTVIRHPILSLGVLILKSLELLASKRVI